MQNYILESNLRGVVEGWCSFKIIHFFSGLSVPPGYQPVPRQFQQPLCWKLDAVAFRFSIIWSVPTSSQKKSCSLFLLPLVQNRSVGPNFKRKYILVWMTWLCLTMWQGIDFFFFPLLQSKRGNETFCGIMKNSSEDFSHLWPCMSHFGAP